MCKALDCMLGQTLQFLEKKADALASSIETTVHEDAHEHARRLAREKLLSPLLVSNGGGKQNVGVDGVRRLHEQRPPFPLIFQVVRDTCWVVILKVSP